MTPNTNSPIADMLVEPGVRVEAMQALVAARAARAREAHGRELADSEIVDAVLRAARSAVVDEERTLRPPPETLKERIDDLLIDLDIRRGKLPIELREQTVGYSSTSAGRELSLAITALEDAQMRVTRAIAIEQDRFEPADLQRSLAPVVDARDGEVDHDGDDDRDEQRDEQPDGRGVDEHEGHDAGQDREEQGEHGPEATRAGGTPNA
jgi:hypothetical protein